MEYRVLRIRFRPVGNLEVLVDRNSWNSVCIPLSTRDYFLNLTYFYYLVVTDCRNRQDGTRRSPWNEIECGDHYARPMAAFLYFEIASGMVKMILCFLLSFPCIRNRFLLKACGGYNTNKEVGKRLKMCVRTKMSRSFYCFVWEEVFIVWLSPHCLSLSSLDLESRGCWWKYVETELCPNTFPREFQILFHSGIWLGII